MADLIALAYLSIGLAVALILFGGKRSPKDDENVGLSFFVCMALWPGVLIAILWLRGRS